ncbi:MAG: terpene cyclase/mutase family protein [Lentisphaeraceae bacterium]|nr:terpene cyclase/mutase family protein [Lentisphaeraceae bacterium]
MKTLAVLFTALFFSASTTFATGIDNSILKEAQVSVNKAVSFLLSKQNENGSWGPYGGMPAFTAIVTNSLLTSPEASSSRVKAAVAKAEQSLLKYVQADGSIWAKSAEKGYPNYSTSVSVVSFYLINKDKHLNLIKKARNFLKKSQFEENTGATPVEAGGIGYGSTKNKSDLSNTQMALEALYITHDVENESTDAEAVKATKECWDKANKFITRCQALPTTNDLKWAKAAPGEDVGGFIYSPDRTKVEGEELRVYGSMTYAGLKSMVYAGYLKEDKLTKEDPRVKAAMEWVGKNYTLDENPGVGAQGHFYYIQTMAKALDAYDQDAIKSKDGKTNLWRRDVVKKLLSLQKSDGHWVNENGRWMENVPEMVTAFSLNSMSHALSKDLK